MRRIVLLLGLCALFWWGVGAWRVSGDPQWSSLGQGLEMRTYSVLSGTMRVRITAFRVSPRYVELAEGRPLTAAAWLRAQHARVAVNAGYFDEMNRPLGLRVARARKVSSLRQADWGVFTIRHGRAAIVHTRDYRPSRYTTMAVQCGPRLVVDGKATQLKPQWARRTGIGIDRTGKVIIAIADGEISFDDWAAQWAAHDRLDCLNALNLDGGGSTQLAVSAAGKHESVAGLWPVPDAVLIQ
jgi:uncharacterized protein YigE (DUF2233 family)